MKQRNGILFLCMKITMYKRGAQGKTQKIGMCMYTARKMKEEMKSTEKTRNEYHCYWDFVY